MFLNGAESAAVPNHRASFPRALDWEFPICLPFATSDDFDSFIDSAVIYRLQYNHLQARAIIRTSSTSVRLLRNSASGEQQDRLSYTVGRSRSTVEQTWCRFNFMLSGRTTATMAPSRNLPDSDASSMVDTPMTDGNESVARIPVDEPDYPMAVSPSPRVYQFMPRASANIVSVSGLPRHSRLHCMAQSHHEKFI